MLGKRIGGSDHQVTPASWKGPTGKGTPQGAAPCLANVYLHYVRLVPEPLAQADGWRRHDHYADDFVCGFQHLGDARRFLRDLGERLAHLNCTRKIIEFGRFARANRRKQGKPETFDFLGMAHFCEQTRKGRFRVGRKPSRKRAPCGGSRRPCAGGGTITGTKRPSGELSTAATTPFQEAACRSSYTNANSCVPFGDAPKRTSPGT